MPIKLIPLDDEIKRQDEKHGRRFNAESELGEIRLGLACLEDEVEEARRAWRKERRRVGWAKTREETLQVAAVAMRLVRQIDEMEVDGPETGEALAAAESVREAELERLSDPLRHVFVAGDREWVCAVCGKRPIAHVQPPVTPLQGHPDA